MSSSVFSAEFTADPLLRRLVLLSGIILNMAGLVMILLLPVHLAVTVVGCISWVGWSVREHMRLRRAYHNFSRLRVHHDGELRVLDRDGNWQDARLLAGSVLLRRAGWIRIRTGEGRVFAELLRGRCRHSPDWRRLQVIWRHVGAVPVSC